MFQHRHLALRIQVQKPFWILFTIGHIHFIRCELDILFVQRKDDLREQITLLTTGATIHSIENIKWWTYNVIAPLKAQNESFRHIDPNAGYYFEPVWMLKICKSSLLSDCYLEMINNLIRRNMKWYTNILLCCNRDFRFQLNEIMHDMISIVQMNWLRLHVNESINFAWS